MSDRCLEKRRLRDAARRARSAATAIAARAIAARLLALPELRRAGLVSGYAALADEVPLDHVRRGLEARGIELVYPRVEGERLALHRVGSARALVPGYRGIREPEATAPVVAPEAVDVFLVPGLLFDREVRRLGRGGGHFDRLLARARPDALRVGLCYAERVVDALPEDPWDIRMDAIVTDREVLRAAVARR